MKAMGLFGGVQIAGILCSIIRTKLVAMWIGPVGVGLFGLFNNALEMISTGTNLGIRSSSVRDISQALTGRNPELVSRMVTVVRKWSMWLGLAGALVTLTLAPLLSQLTFGDSTHIWGFVALSVAVLLQALTNGEYAILQGTARLKRLASVTLWGTIVGLAVSIPLFYWLRERSILPSILAYAAALALFAAGCDKETTLHSNLEERQANLVMAALIDAGITCHKAPGEEGTWNVTVTEAKFAEAVNLLEREGLPRRPHQGIGEVFKKTGMISSPGEERIRFMDALSQDIAKTISCIDGVVDARVHIVLPENDPFARHALPSSAAVAIRSRWDADLTDVVPSVKGNVGLMISYFGHKR
jgi:type III secretion system YscJ/HrcJ family lipoprotein